MKVNSYTNNQSSFKGFYNSKILKKGLEFASSNGALFSAATSLVLSAFVRPVSILLTPKTDKDNKKVACAKSVSSSLIGYGIMLGVSKPIANAIKNIDAAPQKYLSPKSIQTLKNGSTDLLKSKSYLFATQLFKLGLGTIIAMPKAVLVTSLLPVLLKYNKQKEKKSSQPSFTGKSTILEKGIAKILNTSKLQKFATKYKDSNFPMHIIAGTDILTTVTTAEQIKHSKSIDEKRKKPLIYNSAIATGLSIVCGYVTDKLLDKPTQKFIEKFKQANENSPKLDKYLEGIKIAKPVIIMGTIYYAFIPVISTFVADRMAKLSLFKEK